jgi:hypothetical protein
MIRKSRNKKKIKPLSKPLTPSVPPAIVSFNIQHCSHILFLLADVKPAAVVITNVTDF